MRRAIILALHGAVVGVSGCAPASPPNVVIVVLDTVRADALALGSDGGDSTPRLASLAAESTVFSGAISTAPWTIPSHASLFTGLYPHAHGAVHEQFKLDGGHTTLAEILRDAGYETVGFTCNPWLHANSGLEQGFDLWKEIYREETTDQGADLTTSSIEAWLETRVEPDRPFLLFANYLEAHLPYASAPCVEDAARFSILEAEKYITGESALDHADLKRVRKLYDAEVAYLDEHVGRVVDGLRAAGVLEDTLLIVTSDHGEHLGEHGLTGHEFTLFDEVLRVPLIVRYPRRFERGAIVEHPVSLIDIVPTVLELVGLTEALPRLRGRSLTAPVQDSDRDLVAHYGRPVTLIHGHWKKRHPTVDMSRFDTSLDAILRDRFKLIRNQRGESSLFDLTADPRELSDLATLPDQAERRAELEAALDRALVR